MAVEIKLLTYKLFYYIGSLPKPTTQINGEFTLNLSDFSIDRPSLLLKKIDNEIKIEFILFLI